jgi:hypothetical protein
MSPAPEPSLAAREPTAPRLPRAPKLTLALLCALTGTACLALGALAASPAAAEAPWWRLTSRMIPSHLPPGGEGTIVIEAINLGNAPTNAPYNFSDTLPKNLKLEEASFLARPSKAFEQEHSSSAEHADFGPSGENASLGYCESSSSGVSCSSVSPTQKAEARFQLQPLLPYDFIELRLKVKDEGASPGAANRFGVSGGGAGEQSSSRPVAISSSPAGFGVEEFSLTPEEEGGAVDLRAGSHPYQLSTALSFNSDSTETLKPPALPRDLHFKLPPGMVGNATALPQCDEQDFAHVGEGGAANFCPLDTAIGVSVVSASVFPGQEEHFTVPVFNLTPAPGEPARFGFEVLRNPVLLDTEVRSGPGEDYGVTVSVNNVTQLVNFISSITSFWGAPDDPSHNDARGWGCLLGGGKRAEEAGQQCIPSVDPSAAAFLTLPSDCEVPFETTLQGDSWPSKAFPAGQTLPSRASAIPGPGGQRSPLGECDRLTFAPQISAQPSSQSASSPSGLDFNLNFDDEGLTNFKGLAQSELKDISVALAQGLTVNPSAGVGLGGCTKADYEAETLTSAPGEGCPNNSKLGSVEIETPLLSTKVKGSVFLAEPYENPFAEAAHPGGTLLALYVVAKNPENGVLVKLAGKVDRDQSTGQLTTTFKENPQLPFDHFNFHFREGQQAPLITPQSCGSYETQAIFSPWSEPLSSLSDFAAFQITKGSGEGACPQGAPPFAPQIQAGTISNAAGSFSPFSLRLSRTDEESEFSAFSTTLPPGMSGILSGIPFCSEEDIALARSKSGTEERNRPSCPAQSLLGESQVGAGAGAVLAYTPGKVYLAGPYQGDPFSLISVTSATVGPFDLGTVVIRFGLAIDPHTAQVSVDPSASEPIPHIIDGIVTHVREIRVLINRPSFTLNPTSCAPMSISSTLKSTYAQSATVSSPYQAASCESLKFAPKFSVSTAGQTSKAKGASLSVKLSYPPGSLGSYANLARTKVSLPKQLPSRLTTLQKACTAPVFEQSPASCPAASAVGHAKVTTPVLPVPLEGPAYFVSHGNEAFPDLTIVLKGYGVTVDLIGSTQIKNGITTSTFKATPDVPFETFELTLPQGPYSALAANADLCKSKLAMPSEFTAQNGAVITQSTPIRVSGCKKAKLTRKQKLAKALRSCQKKQNKVRRRGCQASVRRRFGG